MNRLSAIATKVGNWWRSSDDRAYRDHIPIAAEMVGRWWADRLDPQFADKREAFAQAVALRVEDVLYGRYYWTTAHERRPGDGRRQRSVWTECDYDPQGLLLEAVREVVDPNCARGMNIAQGILPGKHTLMLDTEAWVLKPKEGRGNWTAPIPVPAPGESTEQSQSS